METSTAGEEDAAVLEVERRWEKVRSVPVRWVARTAAVQSIAEVQVPSQREKYRVWRVEREVCRVLIVGAVSVLVSVWVPGWER